MIEQPNYHEPSMHFDLYSVTVVENTWHVMQMFRNLSWLSAELLAGVEHTDFCASFEHTGWLGTCPEWHGFKPVVTVPRGERLDLDHIDFLMESIS
jgi:hypothetical protein